MGVAVVVLTLNEEKNLHRCLESVLGWAEEVVVVDSGSTDQTCSIGKDSGARVLEHKMSPFYFSEQRNWVLDHGGLGSEWVLFLDADEAMTASLKQKLVVELNSAPQDVVGFQLAPKFIFMGTWLRHTMGYPSWHDRLVRRGRVRFAGGVWEHFATDGIILQVDEPYLHFGFNNGIGAWVDRHNRYSDFEARDIEHTWNIKQHGEASHDEFRTSRKRRLRDLSARFWPLRPVFRFAYMLFIRLSFLDGYAGLTYSLMMAMYEFIIVLKVMERKRRHAGLPF